MSDNGYMTVSVENGLDAIRIISEDKELSLVLLDLMIPFKSGDVVISKVREKSDIPIIVVSAKNMVQSKVEIIRLGADDYITKPFDLDELLVRIESVFRRLGKDGNYPKKDLVYKKLVLSQENGTVTVDGTELILTTKEYLILELMLKNPKKIFSRSNLYESVWNEMYINEDTTIKVHMSNIRRKIKAVDSTEEYIETLWGMGYKLHS